MKEIEKDNALIEFHTNCLYFGTEHILSNFALLIKISCPLL